MIYKDIYELYGSRREIKEYAGHPNLLDITELIATFDNEELAKEYVRKSLVQEKTQSEASWANYEIRGMICVPLEYRYRESSLLRPYYKCEIVLRKKSVEPQHNPTIQGERRMNTTEERPRQISQLCWEIVNELKDVYYLLGEYREEYSKVYEIADKIEAWLIMENEE